MSLLRPVVLVVAAVAAASVAAADQRPGGFFVEAGAGRADTRAMTAGVSWPWTWQRAAGALQLGGRTEAFVSGWRADAVGGGSDNYAMLGVVPLLRLRPNQGRSPWFAEAGIGLSLMDRRFRTPDKQFSTAWNFYDVLAVGRNYGSQGQHELSLRLAHVSNGGARHPNPGQEFVQLRWGTRF